jgi:hypothetical protein
MTGNRMLFSALLTLSLTSAQLAMSESKSRRKPASCLSAECRENAVLEKDFTDNVLKALRGIANRQDVQSSNFVGSFNGTGNFIGYIDFDKNSEVYKSTFKTDKGTGIDGRSPSAQLDTIWLDASGTLKDTAIASKIAEIEASKESSFLSFCDQEIQAKPAKGKVGMSAHGCAELWKNRERYQDHELVMDWKSKRPYIARELAIQRLKDAYQMSISDKYKDKSLRATANTRDTQLLFARLFEGIDTFEAVRNESPYTLNTAVGVTKGYLNLLTKKLTFRSDRYEATNLVRPQSDANSPMFYSSAELRAMKAAGKDTSTIDPLDSGLWRKPKQDVSNCDIENYDGTT